MKSNYYQNSFKNFNSDYFCLIPSKYVTFGIQPLNKSLSQISENSSNKENNSDFKQFSIEDKFKFDFDKSISKEQFMNYYSKNTTPKIIQCENNFKENNSNCYLDCFKLGSKTILNIVNSCLLDLFSNTNKNISNPENNTNNKIQKNTNNKYVLKALNEDCIIINNENNETKKNTKAVSFLQKINFSPVKKITISENNYIPEIPQRQEHQNIFIKEKNSPNPTDKFCFQSAFNIINNNYENPAKILPQFNSAPKILNVPNMPCNNIPNITNITNVTNNYFFQCNNNSDCFIKHNNEIQSDKIQNNIIINKINNSLINSTFKLSKVDEGTKIKNLNTNNSYGLYQLNQISVNGVSISKFPVVSMNEDDLEVQLISKMLTETDYFTIVDKYYINIPVLDEEKYNKPLYDKIFKKEKEKISDLYLIGKNMNENNPVNLIRNFYAQIKSKILQIQKNYLSNNKQDVSLNKELCKELEKLIISCNAITNTVTDYKKSGLKRKLFQEENSEDMENKKNLVKIMRINKNNSEEENVEDELDDNILLNKKRKPKKKHFKTYLCEFCNKAYSNGQGLGGHMSRIHPNQSYKYKDKIRIRREREEKRENLLNIKRDLFKKYGFDYDKLVTEKNKVFIQKFLSEHNEEYKNIRKISQKNEKDKENTININEDNEDIINKDEAILVTPVHPKLIKVSPTKLNLLNNLRKNFSKEKTCDKTDNKDKEKLSDKEDNIEFKTKIKINFSEDK